MTNTDAEPEPAESARDDAEEHMKVLEDMRRAIRDVQNAGRRDDN